MGAEVARALLANDRTDAAAAAFEADVGCADGDEACVAATIAGLGGDS